ncbi:DnaD domain protein [Ruminococcus sp. NK3A76]|uniref:DnaD domain protein n=1 Tax=Ruminococcus sp. NK3A76 TaxID=877411 RepID=UPI00048A83ED|nr:DnaD domain protein [Ruminococcus sp. NK3A76]
MEVKLGFSMLGRVFMMPASVVDEYIKISTGEQIKVLMCIYCLGSEKIRTEDIAGMAGVSEQTVREAVIHFSKLGVFTASGLTGAEAEPAQEIKPALQPAAGIPVQTVRADEITPVTRDTSRNAKVRYTPREIAAKIEQDNALNGLMQSMEQLMGRQLTHSNVGDVLEMYEHLELDPASILMIAEYCKSLDKCRTAYILRVAQEWFDEGISEFDAVERKIINLGRYNSFEAKIKRLIGLDGAATKKQRTYIASWQDMGFDFDMVRLAYEQNIDNTGKLSFPYMDKILHGWQEKGIHTPAQAEQAGKKFREEKKPGQDGGITAGDVAEFERSIDFDKLTT